MPVKTGEIIQAASIIADNHNIRVTVKSSLKASFTVAATTFTGALLLGPPGIMIGATAGGLYAYKQSRGQFKSAAIIIRDELTEDQKDRFVAHLVEAFSEFHPEDAVALVAILMTNQALVVTKIGQFLISEMGMNIID